MKNYLVVGQGLAGIAIAETLLEAGWDVNLIDCKGLPSSTAIATGMYNPIVFRHLNKSWMIDTLLPVMHRFYEAIEEKLGVELDRSISFYKRIPNKQYADRWVERQKEEGFAAYLGDITEGAGEVFQAGIIDCAALKQAYGKHMARSGRLNDMAFDHDKLTFRNGKAFYVDVPYDGIIFCEGPHAVKNPYFNWLPFNICKGEWIVIQTDRPVTDRVINNVINVIPLGENRYKLSSTYTWNDLDWEPTTGAEEELRKAFDVLFTCNYEVIGRAAGLRPTVADRRPFIGTHPEHPSLHIFNGLGSKGVMLAPYFARHLADHLMHGTPLFPEVDIKRHLKKLSLRSKGKEA